MAKWVNLTPHPIRVVAEDGETVLLEVEPAGSPARCTVSYEVVSEFDGVQVVKSTLGAIEGLPRQLDDMIYIVSSMVAQAAAGRADVVAPDTGPTAVRNEAGQVVAVKRFQRF